MAYTKTPTQDTYDTKRFPLVGMPMQRNGRDTLKDQRLLNCYAEQIKAQVTEAKKYYVKKRWGLHDQIAPNFGRSRGCIYDFNTNKLFYVFGSRLFVFDGTTTVQIFGSVAGGNKSVGFTIHLTTTVSIVMLTGGEGYVINPFTNGITQITSGNFPVPHVPNPVSMDGYLFIAKLNTADIYNSDLDDPFTWTPGNFITAEMYPDYILALTKNNNYVIAVGSGSCEYFYDVGGATGSPLQRNPSVVLQVGTPAPETVVQTEKEVFMVGGTGNGGWTVWKLEGFNGEEVATEAVRNSLSILGPSILDCIAMCIRVDGHKFYVINLPASNRTWVYDCDSKLWSEWSSQHPVNGTQKVFKGRYAADSYLGFPFIMSDDANGIVMIMNDTTYTDSGFPIKMQFTTLKLDFDNMKRKGCSRTAVFGDWPLDTTSQLGVEWSDDDYRTWSTMRFLQLSSNTPWVRRCGRFIRRALRFTHTDPTPLRLEGAEMDIDQGTS